jgi:hypothetical protein
MDKKVAQETVFVAFIYCLILSAIPYLAGKEFIYSFGMAAIITFPLLCLTALTWK